MSVNTAYVHTPNQMLASRNTRRSASEDDAEGSAVEWDWQFLTECGFWDRVRVMTFVSNSNN